VQIKVLVIDDDHEMTELLKMTLEQDTYEVLKPKTGAEGVELARHSRPDVVIVDLFMADVDGLQVCRDIRKFSSVPILVLSAINKPEMVAQALDAGADDYLIKPLKISVLTAYLNKIARRASLGGFGIQPNNAYSH
jgi:two-component system KDP operon response regulator KdpE